VVRQLLRALKAEATVRVGTLDELFLRLVTAGPFIADDAFRIDKLSVCEKAHPVDFAVPLGVTASLVRKIHVVAMYEVMVLRTLSLCVEGFIAVVKTAWQFSDRSAC